MTEKFIAIAPKGQEFFYKRSSMIAVPKTSANKIAKALTDLQYKIKDGEVWHVYDNNWAANYSIEKEIKRYGKRMPVYRYEG